MRQTIACLAFVVGLMCVASGQGRAQSAPPMPDADGIANGLTVLVRTTVVALNHANRTGNYTVFRDLGSPGFQEANTAASLASSFAKFRAQNLNLGPVVLFDPEFTKQPGFDEQGLLRLTGFIPTSPLHVHFDLAYQWIEKRWRLSAISVQTKQPPAAAKTP